MRSLYTGKSVVGRKRGDWNEEAMHHLAKKLWRRPLPKETRCSRGFCTATGLIVRIRDARIIDFEMFGYTSVTNTIRRQCTHLRSTHSCGRVYGSIEQASKLP